MSDKNGVILERFKSLVNSSKKTRQAIAKDMGCDTSTVTKQYNGDLKLSVDYLVKYAKYFGVSADYLLGLSEEPSTDKDMQYICDYTGLSLAAVDNLHSISEDERYKDIVNQMIKSPKFKTFVDTVYWFCKHSRIYDSVFDWHDSVNHRRTMKNNVNLDLFIIQEMSKDFAKRIYRLSKNGGAKDGND